jgi:hypothetical protein
LAKDAGVEMQEFHADAPSGAAAPRWDASSSVAYSG